ncbi:MAG: DUF2868 domain-containing protein [Pseudomonadota bacterium]|nr:DUF2868 domain-containing protein [Pseudomonadota bacterium]
MTHTSLLSDLIDLISAFQADDSTGYDEKKIRDRNIGRALRDLEKNPPAQVRGWLAGVKIPGFTRIGQNGAQLYHVLCLILVVAGLATGWGLARAVLHYDGTQPINVVNALGLLVLPQLLLLLLWLLASMPVKIPLFSSLQSALRLLNPGKLARHLARLFPSRTRQSLSTLWGTEQAAALTPVTRWLFSFWSQLFAFGFNIGVLAAAFYLISFSDLAFAWSTTLRLDSDTFHRFLFGFSWPWHTFAPEAVPSLELVQNSRYFRFDEGSLGSNSPITETPARLGEWWPFLIAAVTCYGLLPRLATLVVSWFRLRHHLRQALVQLPGSVELLARMNSLLVSTSALEPEAVFTPTSGPDIAKEITLRAGLKCAVIDWSDATGSEPEVETQLRETGIEAVRFYSAGGAQTTAADAEIIASLCDAHPEAVALLVKSWEPPLLEFLDFLHALRQRCGKKIPLIVLLGGADDGVSPRDHEIWRVTLRRLRDPKLQIEPLPGIAKP